MARHASECHLQDGCAPSGGARCRVATDGRGPGLSASNGAARGRAWRAPRLAAGATRRAGTPRRGRAARVEAGGRGRPPAAAAPAARRPPSLFSRELDAVEADPAVAAPVVGRRELYVGQVLHAVAAAALEGRGAVVDGRRRGAAVPRQVVGPLPVVVCQSWGLGGCGGLGGGVWGCEGVVAGGWS
jgi:hypothetical protein